MGREEKIAGKVAIVGVAVIAAVWLVVSDPYFVPHDLPAGLAPHAPQRCIAVFLVCMALWFTNLIPLAATGLMVFALLPLLGVMKMEDTFAFLGNRALFFMLGVFLLAAATIATGLSKRITLLALHRFDASPGRLVAGVTVSAAFLSLWMPEHAVAAMLYPIVMEVVDSLGLPVGHNYSKKMLLALSYGPVIGGVGTLLGGARGPLALDLLRQMHPGTTISFLGWMVACLPVVVIMVLAALAMLRWKVPDGLADIKSATAMLRERVRVLGPMSGPERRLAVLGVATIASWILLGDKVDLALIAICSASMLFVLRIVDWKQVQPYVNWGVLLLYGGAIAIGKATQQTRALSYFAEQVMGPSIPPIVVIIVMVAATIFLTEFLSNAAAVVIMLPIGFSLGQAAGVDPVAMTLAVTLASGLGFALPVGSPPNAISFSAGHYSLREAMAWGWPLDVVALIVVVVVMYFWWPLIGLL